MTATKPEYSEASEPRFVVIDLPPISTKVEVQDGKYCFVSEGDGTVKCLRYGEEWLTFDKGRNALIALIHHTASLEANETIDP